MRLIIENSFGDDNLKEFIQNSIIPAAQELVFPYLDKKQLQRFTDYLTKEYGVFLDAKTIIILGMKSLIIGNIGDDYYIQLNPNVFVPKTSAKLIDLCSLINYGNLQISPYNIFDIVMSKLADMIPELYQQYYYGI